MFRSGNIEHPEDRFHNTTIEVLPWQQDTVEGGSSVEFNTTTDGYIVVGAFDQLGVAEGSIPAKLGMIQELRLKVNAEPENWVILNEVSGKISTFKPI